MISSRAVSGYLQWLRSKRLEVHRRAQKVISSLTAEPGNSNDASEIHSENAGVAPNAHM